MSEQVEQVKQVNHPDHYKNLGIEPIDVIEMLNLDFHLGNALKYTARAGLKGNRKVDLEKACWYLRRRIEWKDPPNRYPLKGKMASIVGVQKSWKLPAWLDLAVYNIMCAATVVEERGFLVCLQAALAYIENEIAGK